MDGSRDRVRLRTAREIGLRIRDRRMHLGLSQAELAERVGMTRQWVIGLEKGAPGAALGTVLRTLAELGLALDISAPHQGPQSSALTSARQVPVEQIRNHVDSVGSRGRNSPEGRPNSSSRTPLQPAKK